MYEQLGCNRPNVNTINSNKFNDITPKIIGNIVGFASIFWHSILLLNILFLTQF